MMTGPYDLGSFVSFEGDRVTEDGATVDQVIYTASAPKNGSIQVFLLAADRSGAQYAFILLQVLFGKSDNNTTQLSSSMLSGAFEPNVAPWNTLAAPTFTFVGDDLVLSFSGLAGVKIHWSWTLLCPKQNLFPA